MVVGATLFYAGCGALRAAACALEDKLFCVCPLGHCDLIVMLSHVFLLLGLSSHVFAQSHVAFDRATASSLYSSGAYSAGQALAAGSGYWCRCVCVVTSSRCNNFFVQFWRAHIRADSYMDWASGRAPSRRRYHVELVRCFVLLIFFQACVCIDSI